MAAGFALLATNPAAPLFGLAILVFGVGFTLAHSTLQTRTTEVSPTTRGTAVSLFAGLGNVGAALGTLAAGALIDGVGFGATFAVVAAGLAALAATGPPALRSHRASHSPPAAAEGPRLSPASPSRWFRRVGERPSP
jgi:predicted MFS family arabinose efflux permease